MDYNTVHFRFYEELNDFLPADRRKISFVYKFKGKTTVKDAIEATGVPHTEIDLILVNGNSVGFNYIIRDGDIISVYPVFETLDISPVVRLRPKPLRKCRFILDVHLGKLARFMRMLGFDASYRNDYDDSEIVKLSVKEKRIVLTRDLGILKQKAVTHGYWLRATDPYKQLSEVLNYFDLFSAIKPFSRCIKCNGIINEVDKNAILSELPEDTAKYYNKFRRCSDCKKIYWEGSHYLKMNKLVSKIKKQSTPKDL